MLRLLVCAVLALGLTVGFVLADEYRGEVKSVNGDTITISVDGKDVKLTTTIATSIVAGKPGKEKVVKGGLKGLKEGAKVTVTTEKKDGKETVTKIHVEKKK